MNTYERKLTLQEFLDYINHIKPDDTFRVLKLKTSTSMFTRKTTTSADYEIVGKYISKEDTTSNGKPAYKFCFEKKSVIIPKDDPNKVLEVINPTTPPVIPSAGNTNTSAAGTGLDTTNTSAGTSSSDAVISAANTTTPSTGGRKSRKSRRKPTKKRSTRRRKY
jgi:hypothetical protein